MERGENDRQVGKALASMPNELLTLLHHPEHYTGNAAQQAIKIAKLAERTAVKI